MAPLVRLDVWSDYVCPFCYLEEPVLTRIIDEFGNDVKVNWQAFELRPEPVPTLDPDGEYLHRVWNASVYPMASERGMNLKLPPVQPRRSKTRRCPPHSDRELMAEKQILGLKPDARQSCREHTIMRRCGQADGSRR